MKRKPKNVREEAEARSLAEDLGRHALALDVAAQFLLEGSGFAVLRTEIVTAGADPLGEEAAAL